MPKHCIRDFSTTYQPDCCVLAIRNRAITPFSDFSAANQHNCGTRINIPIGTLIMGTREILAKFKTHVRGAKARATF
eukprot:2247628-Pyramimonas_sp.AAC.1